MSYKQIAIVRGCSDKTFNMHEYLVEERLAQAAPLMLATLKAALLALQVEATEDERAKVRDLVQSAISCAGLV